MFSEKLGSLLLQLSAPKMQKLQKFIQSPYFNEHEAVTLLFLALRAAHTKGHAHIQSLEKERLWSLTFGNVPYRDAHLRKLMHELTQLVYQFMSIEVFLVEPYHKTRTLLSELDTEALQKHRVQIEQRLFMLLNENLTWRPEQFMQAHELNFASLDQDNLSNNLSTKIADAQRHLDVFYVLRSLKMNITIKTYRISRNDASGFMPPPDFMPQLEQSPLLLIPIVEVYYLASNSFAEPENDALYQAFKQSLVLRADALHPADLYDLYQYALNFCVLRINTGQSDFYRELFNLYQHMTESDLIVAKGQLAEGIFKNIITAGLAVKEYEWVEQFIRNKSTHLPESVQENAMSFNLANVLFSQRKYNDVIGLLQRVEYSDIVYHLGARWLLIRTYYELDAQKALESLLESFRIYLLRNKVISASTKKEYLSLISFTRRVLKSKYEPEKRSNLKAKIQATQIKLPKRWLIEKIDELDQNRR
jgi:hypothetical protein